MIDGVFYGGGRGRWSTWREGKRGGGCVYSTELRSVEGKEKKEKVEGERLGGDVCVYVVERGFCFCLGLCNRFIWRKRECVYKEGG